MIKMSVKCWDYMRVNSSTNIYEDTRIHLSSNPQNVQEGTRRIIRHPQNIYENTTGVTHSPVIDLASNGITRLRGSTPLLPITATVPFCFSLSFQQFSSHVFLCFYCVLCCLFLVVFITCTGMTSWTHSTCEAFYKNRFKAIIMVSGETKAWAVLGLGSRLGDIWAGVGFHLWNVWLWLHLVRVKS